MKSMKSACKASAAKKLSNMRKAYANGGRTGYALGGDVEDDMDEPLAPASMKDDLGIDGHKAKKRLDKGGKTNINIVIAAGKDKGPEMAPPVPPMPPVPGKPPMPPMPPMAGAGGPPPMKNGGRMAYKHGGRVKCADGGVPRKGMPGTQSGMDIPDYGRMKAQSGKNPGLDMMNQPMPKRANGGKVQHVIKHAAGGGLGRLEKIKAYGLKPAKGGK